MEDEKKESAKKTQSSSEKEDLKESPPKKEEASKESKEKTKKKDQKEKQPESKETKEQPKTEKKKKKEKEKEPEKEKKEAPPKEKSAPTPPPKKKINKMSLDEVEAKLKDVEEKMGGLSSKYAQQLLRRKNFLSSQNKSG